MKLRWLMIAVALAVAQIATPALAALEGRLFVVTSFPESLFGRFKGAFEARHPGVRVHVRNRKTSAAISFVQERINEPVDLIWVSAPDAFEILKRSDNLVQLSEDGATLGAVGGYPLDDPQGYYRGFAISGYGIMWNIPYLARLGLPPPARWGDLANPEYYRHVGISPPSRSGTMHLIVETILQGKGWDDGWATLLEMGGNLATVTARSYGVVEGVSAGRFGIGPVIDFFGLSARATGAPVEFVYPDGTAFLPANIAVVKRGPNRQAAFAFIDFLLSPQGQQLLFEPEIRRLPVRRDAYRDAPAGYPNPFDSNLVGKGITLDIELSRTRYHLVNALFDVMVTYRVKSLNRAWKAIHEAEAALATKDDPELQARLGRARDLASEVPLTEAEASDPALAGEFFRHKSGLPLPARQANMEREWERLARAAQAEAARIAGAVLTAIESGEAETQQ